MHTRMLLGGYDRELERYGVEGMRGGGRAMEMTGKSYRSAEDVEKDIINAARNDYDLRRTMEAAALSGKKKAIDLQKKGFKSIDDVTNWGNFSEKAAKRHGQGGDFSSASDYMGLTKSMVQRDRRKFTEANDAKYATKEELNALEQKEAAQEAFDDADVDLSPDVQAAKDRASEWSKNLGGDVYGASGGEDEQDSSAVMPTDTDSYEAGQSYLSGFKEKLKSKGKFTPTL